MLFAMLLRRFVRHGSIRLVDARGREQTFGDGQAPRVTLRLHRRSLGYTLAFRPTLAIGEAFMRGDLTVEEGEIYDLLEVLACNVEMLETNPLFTILGRLKLRFPRGISGRRAKSNVAHHYDLSGELYRLFLDRDQQYSCGYFAEPGDDLESAQLKKKRHLAAKLYLDRPGLKVLDIGSGWGGLGLYLAREAGAEVTGLTLSTEQHEASNRRARAAMLADRACFHLRDYREETGLYDRIVSVGMFEHVGRRNYPDYFRAIRDRLSDDGVAVVHSIGYFGDPVPINPFIAKYIFPGAELPSLSEVLAVVEHQGLMVADVEILRLHYAETLRAWRQRFVANWEAAARLYDERFCRMWLFYLAFCEIGFRYRGLMVFQLQLTKRLDALPITRDYMVDWERAHGASDRGKAARRRRGRAPSPPPASVSERPPLRAGH